MKMPQLPPDFDSIRQQLKNDPDRLAKILNFNVISGGTGVEKYLHWDKLRRYSTPEGFSYEEWWFALKMQRRRLFKTTPLLDKKGEPFKHLNTDPISEILHEIDQGAGGYIQMPDQIINPETKDQYYVNSLIQEAITSSQLEGAATTRKVAKELIQTGRKPQDRSEQMILNNYVTMRQIGKLKHEQLSKDLVFEIHRCITEKTLDDLSEAGRFRRTGEKINIRDEYGEVFHEPPPADQLEERLVAMCDFANGKKDTYFIHPVIRSIILHFWLAYDHPFTDGNGRTARALFYWSMLRNGFWLFEFISISQIILNAPSKYGRAFLYTETDENDLTYFILYHLEVIRQAIKKLHEYIKERTKKLQAIESELRGISVLNHRQRALVSHGLRHPHYRYTIESHHISHNVVYQTARTDLLDLERRGLLESSKVGKTFYFTPVKHLEKKLAKLI
jgi:Fic family protein